MSHFIKYVQINLFVWFNLDFRDYRPKSAIL